MALPASATVEVIRPSSAKTFSLPVAVFSAACNLSPILGRAWASTLPHLFPVHLMKLVVGTDLRSFLAKYEDLFKDELGSFTGSEATIHVRHDFVPKFFKSRQVPQALQPAVKSELIRLQEQGIIITVKFSPWATPIVPVLNSDGTIRICGDYKLTINPVTEQEVYPLPLIADLFAQLAGGKLFSKLDLSHAYLQLKLSAGYQDITGESGGLRPRVQGGGYFLIVERSSVHVHSDDKSLF
jgi:hypothetical protein